MSVASLSGELLAGNGAPGGPRRGVAGRLLVALGIGLPIMIVVCAFAKPRMMVRLLPRTAQIYAAVGAPVNIRGFDFEHVTARFEETGDGRFLEVEGSLRNVARAAGDAPRLRIALRDAKGGQVYFWTASSGVKALRPGEVAPFRARLAAPPPEALTVTVDFMPVIRK
ncbi:MAG: FxLYD domain-containing protein [Hyphomicrobiales bacterium]